MVWTSTSCSEEERIFESSWFLVERWEDFKVMQNRDKSHDFEPSVWQKSSMLSFLQCMWLLSLFDLYPPSMVSKCSIISLHFSISSFPTTQKNARGLGSSCSHVFQMFSVSLVRYFSWVRFSWKKNIWNLFYFLYLSAPLPESKPLWLDFSKNFIGRNSDPWFLPRF